MHREFRARVRAALIMVVGLCAVQSLAVLAQTSTSKGPASAPLAPGTYQPDTFLIMVNPDADKEEVATSLREAKGTVLSTIGSGAMTTLVVQTEPGQLEETEKKLAKDDHFGSMQRIAISHGHSMSDGNPNDPYFPKQWYLGAMEIPAAWNKSTGRGVTIAVLDSGCQWTVPDLTGRVYAGADFVTARSRGCEDTHSGSHGTVVASIIASKTDNSTHIASGACDSFIFPIKIAWEDNNRKTTTDDKKIIEAIKLCGEKRIRLIQMSYGGSGSNGSFANVKNHEVLHKWLKWFHDEKGGLFIASAGNEGQFDLNGRLPYLIMVNAVDETFKKAKYSNHGFPIWFCAPGTSIGALTRDNKMGWATGTSYSAPLVASIAAMIMAQNPRMTNKQVEQALIGSCRKFDKNDWSINFGYGMPIATAALGSSRGMGDADESGPPVEEFKPEGPEFELQQPGTDGASPTGSESVDGKKPDSVTAPPETEDTKQEESKPKENDSPTSVTPSR